MSAMPSTGRDSLNDDRINRPRSSDWEKAAGDPAPSEPGDPAACESGGTAPGESGGAAPCESGGAAPCEDEGIRRVAMGHGIADCFSYSNGRLTAGTPAHIAFALFL